MSQALNAPARRPRTACWETAAGGGRVVGGAGLQEFGCYRVPTFGNVGQGASQPMHDRNAIDAVRVNLGLPFVGAGPAQRRQRRDARFPWARA
jgi:hypothetical protein